MENKPGIIELEPVIWWGIDSKNEVKKYDSPSRKSNVYWIKQSDEGERYTTSWQNTYSIYKYEIFNNKITNSEIVLNGWKIRRIYDPKSRSSYNPTQVEYVDPLDELRRKPASDVKNAIAYLNEICEYHNWQMFDLSKSNKKLIDDNERLKEENEELNLKVDAFLETRLYKRMLKKAQGIIHPKANSKTVLKTFIKEYGVNSVFIHQWFKK